MHPNIEKLIQLQKIEIQIKVLGEELKQLPQRLKLMEKKLEKTSDLLEQGKEDVKVIEFNRRQAENKIKVVEEKISKYRVQLSDVKTNEQYKALLQEIDFQNERIHTVEDDILKDMEKEDRLKVNYAELEEKHRQEVSQVSDEKKIAQKSAAEMEIKLEQCEKERDTLIMLISPEVYRIYRSISDIRKGIGLARATESCQGCHVRIRPSILSRVMGNQEILTCESCNRILYWQPDGPYEVSS